MSAAPTSPSAARLAAAEALRETPRALARSLAAAERPAYTHVAETDHAGGWHELTVKVGFRSREAMLAWEREHVWGVS